MFSNFALGPVSDEHYEYRAVVEELTPADYSDLY
jgi:hypothetical protein